MAVFINEFHYDNNSTDIGEFIEIAGTAGTNLSGYSLLLYNGSGGVVYNTLALSGTIVDQGNGFGVLSFAYPSNGIQNGAPDGIALVGPGNVVIEFISYEGVMTATDGAAAGMTSVDVGVLESGTLNGTSIARTGTGSAAGDFTWTLDSNDTPGATNNGQSFVGVVAGEAQVSISDVTLTEGNAGTQVMTFTVTRSDTNGDFTVDFATTGGTATADVDYAAANGTLTFVAGGAASQTVSVTINGDETPEGTETFNVLLSNLVNTSGTAVLADDSGTGTISNDDSLSVFLHDIQGSAFFSPILAEEGVSSFNTASTRQVTVTAVVTAIDNVGSERGFYIVEEMSDWDGSNLTSEGIFVRTSAAVSGLVVGETVTLTANVMEAQSFTNLPRTILVNATNIIQGNDSVALPTLVLDGTEGKAIPNQIVSDDNPDFTDSADDALDTFDPENDGLDFYETIEGMRVTITNMVVADGFVGGSNDNFVYFNAYSTDHADASLINERGGYTITGDPQSYPVDTADAGDNVNFGGSVMTDGAIHPDILELDFGNVGRGGASAFDELLTMGDKLGDVTGIIDFDFGVTKFYVTDALDPTAVANLGTAPVQEVTTIADAARSLTIATFNVENLSPVGTTFSTNNGVEITAQTKYDLLAQHISVNLNAPDILIIEEVQDNNGVTADGTVEADQTWEALVAAVNAATGKNYQWVDEAPLVSGDVGGAPGGNIRVGFLYDTDRVQLGNLAADATLAERRQYTDRIGDGVRDAGDMIAIDDSMTGAVNAADWAGTRRSIVGEFTFNGQTVYAFGNHLPSKGGSGEPYQLNQNVDGGAPANGDWALRNQLAEDIYALQNLASTTTGGRVVAGGDFNEFWFYRPLEILTGYVDALGNPVVGGTQYSNLMVDLLPAAERFSYDFDGRSQALDTLIADAAMAAVASYDIVHINTGYNERTGAVNPASSDHDPSLASFDMRDFGEVLNGTIGNDGIDGFGGDDVLNGLGGDDVLNGDAGSDTLIGGHGNDMLIGGDDNDRLLGGGGDDILNGGAGNDNMQGGNGINMLFGGAGDDRMQGGDNSDVLIGGEGRDIMTGGLGSDTFVFTSIADSVVNNVLRDRIQDFVHGVDKIDLSAIDAVAGGADDAFTVVARFTGAAGEVVLNSNATNSSVMIDLDGDRAADMSLLLMGATVLDASDFLL